VLWRLGDALWDYHGGLGALLVPAIKAGETGWLSALLERVSRNRWPEFARTADLVCAVPTSWPRRWRRGFDLAEAAGALVAGRLGKPFRGLLRKAWFAPAQAGRSESLRRRLPVNAIRPCRDRRLHGETVLLVDDVWTTGTTLARAARALGGIGAGAVLVLALFRACPATAKVL
jgi:predicted amidophosphoribosyltransferase